MRLHQNDRSGRGAISHCAPYLSSRVAQTTPVRLGPRDLALVERANEFCEVLRCAQDDSKGKIGIVENKIELMRGGALVDGAVFRHLVILNQTKAPIDQGLFVFVS